ncbi:malic enzyme [Phlyctochytrium arcticum]|nr:malic enzyme [Phlyctochytrium arcticum]
MSCLLAAPRTLLRPTASSRDFSLASAVASTSTATTNTTTSPTGSFPLAALPLKHQQHHHKNLPLKSHRSPSWPQHSFPALSPKTNPAMLADTCAFTSSAVALNQGTSVPLKHRHNLKVQGLIPPAFENLDQQVDRVLKFLSLLDQPIAQHYYLSRLRQENTILFYKVVASHLTQITPLIYTPVVGEACQQFSVLHTPGSNEGLYLSLRDKGRVYEVLDNWHNTQPEICVITDGSRILGLGDLGMNGMGIPIGKLSLYVAAGGFNPATTLPITLDLGTNNQTYLNDPLYLGLRQKRPTDEDFFSFFDEVMESLHRKWPKMLIQFEDFSSEHAFQSLARYREKYLSFNDDIQGTGAVILSGFINAIRLSEIPIQEHRVLFFGAGSAGVGVASSLQSHFVRAGNMSEEAARDKFWLVDSKGLVTFDRGDKLADHKTLFARSDNQGQQFRTLEEVIEYVRPTALIGLASQHGSFTKNIIERMATLNQRPIIFPLSNPLTSTECTFAEAMEHTQSRVLFASGTAFPHYVNPKTGKSIEPGQGNNMYIFPGLGRGAGLAQSRIISDSMIYQSAVTLAGSLDAEERAEGRLYPCLTRIRDISNLVARDVILAAFKEREKRKGTISSF